MPLSLIGQGNATTCKLPVNVWFNMCIWLPFVSPHHLLCHLIYIGSFLFWGGYIDCLLVDNVSNWFGYLTNIFNPVGTSSVFPLTAKLSHVDAHYFIFIFLGETIWILLFIIFFGEQAIMYVLCFRMRSLMDIPRLKMQLLNMPIEPILKHKLRPLKVMNFLESCHGL